MVVQYLKTGTGFILMIGVVVMAVNVFRYHRLLKRHRHLKHCGPKPMRCIFSVHLALMIFFLVGYLGVVVAMARSISLVSDVLIAIIFLLGAIFVLLGTEVQNRMMEEANRNYYRAIGMLVRAVEIRDPYTMGHSEHVANLAMLIHSHLSHRWQKEIDPDQLQSTALMHDIGKIGVPERVLNKPGKPTDAEWELIRNHTTIGRDLMNKMEVCSSVPEWVVYHHERIDGKGYHGLSGEDIPFAARLLSVADTFSAVVTNRPYRRGKSYRDAVAILEANAGTQLDEYIVRIFCDIPRQQVEACRPEALVLDFLKEIEKVEMLSAAREAREGLDGPLSREAGELWLSKLARFCRQRKDHLVFAAVSLTGTLELERDSGYHVVDGMVERIGKLLADNLRNTDVVVHCRRDVYILALPKCPEEQAVNLMDRLLSEISIQLQTDGLDQTVGTSKRLVCYQPEQNDTWISLTDFFGDFFGKALVDV
jgi:HD-GYP domain-containing protein (c-di-GMP phosphodiesterase class II)